MINQPLPLVPRRTFVLTLTWHGGLHEFDFVRCEAETPEEARHLVEEHYPRLRVVSVNEEAWHAPSPARRKACHVPTCIATAPCPVHDKEPQ